MTSPRDAHTRSENYKNRPIPLIHGPTASGKTALAHRLCDLAMAAGQPVAVLNADAFQFYRGFSIGTAKPTPEEIERYRYSFVDILEPTQSVDANVYGQQARDWIETQCRAGVFVVVVGGSGLYCRSLLHGLDVLPARNDHIRHFLREVARLQGRDVLHYWLSRIDPERAGHIHPSDLVRSERALEIYLETGQKASSLGTKLHPPREQGRLLNARVINLRLGAAELLERITRRTRALILNAQDLDESNCEGPWVTEVRDLLDVFGAGFEELPAARAIGYREIALACRQTKLLSKDALEALCAQITTKTAQYAKRQRTWLGTAASDVEISESEAVVKYAEVFFRE